MKSKKKDNAKEVCQRTKKKRPKWASSYVSDCETPMLNPTPTCPVADAVVAVSRGPASSFLWLLRMQDAASGVLAVRSHHPFHQHQTTARHQSSANHHRPV